MNTLSINEHGVEIVRNIVSHSEMETIKNEVAGFAEDQPGHGIRNADKKLTSICRLANSNKLMELAKSILGSRPQIVRVIFFDKTPEKNWLVTWHQDKTIALSHKAEVNEWGPWSIKDNVHHVQPSLDVLNSMVTFRVHIDGADVNNGCLKVVLKSHMLGILSQKKIENITSRESYLCQVNAGDMVIMKPLILHSSNKSLNPNHRRVVHIEYSNYKLPGELSWA